MNNDIAFSRTRQPLSTPAFVVDPGSIVRDNGRQIAWDQLDSRYFHDVEQVVINGAVAIGDTDIDVDALTVFIPRGTTLNFGENAIQTVTVSASALAAATSISVNALTQALPNGTVLDFGTNKFARLTAAAAIGATSLTVSAIPTALAGGETASYRGGEIVVQLTEDADIGETNLTVDPVLFAIADNAVAYVPGDTVSGTGRYLPAGTCMDILSDGTIVPSALGTAGVTAYGFLETPADEASQTDAATGYGVITGGFLYENLLPEAAGDPAVIDSAWKTEILARGAQLMFNQYEDSTSS